MTEQTTIMSRHRATEGSNGYRDGATEGPNRNRDGDGEMDRWPNCWKDEQTVG